MERVLKDDFKFWCPVAIEKAIDETTGVEIMRLGGIASTMDKDSDGEFLDPKGFDIEPLMKSGTVNWHHQAKGAPATIVGEPSKGEIRPEGLYIETDLYPSSKIARDVYELALTLAKDSKTRRLGYSIEGKVLQRKSNDKKSPDYKIITKASITGVAITHQPKNAQTFADIIKGEGSDPEEDEEEKSMDTTSAAPLVKESVDKKVKNQTFCKSEVMERIFIDIPTINIEKAEKIYSLLLKISNMNDRKTVTDADIEKAYEVLGLDIESSPETIVKAEEAETKEEPAKEAEETAAEEAKEEVKKAEENEEVKKENRFDTIEKAIADSHKQTKNFITAAAVLIKECSQKLDSSAIREAELLDVIKGNESTILGLSQQLEEFGSSSPAPKSLRNTAAVDKNFAKAGDNDFNEKPAEDGLQRVSMKNQKKAIAAILDEATFQKGGYDEEYGAACTHFEANKNLPEAIINRVKREFGIQIVA